MNTNSENLKGNKFPAPVFPLRSKDAEFPHSRDWVMAEHLGKFLGQVSRLSENWLFADDSCQFTQLAQQLYLELTTASYFSTPPKILLAERQPVQFLAGFIAAVAAGCPVFLGNPDWVKAEWQQVFDLVQPDLIWGQEASQMRLARNSLLPNPKSSSAAAQSAISNRIMIPTGGSSGQIRFAMHTWETLMASVQGFQHYFQLKQVNSFCLLPLYHVSGLMQFMRSFTTGGHLVIIPFKALENGEECDIEPSEFFISLVPSQLQRFLQNPALTAWLSRFQTVLLGSAPAWQELLQQARSHSIRLALTYGMTETASQIATLKPEAFLNGDHSCGQILPHAKVIIRASSGEILGANNIGNITIQADSLALGYYPNLANRQYFPVDDLGFIDDWGNLNIVGRSSQKIITGGENVFPAEVEAAIRSTQMVADVCVIGLSDRYWGQVVTAVYVPNSPEVDTKTLPKALENKLSKFKRPKYWISVTSLPRNSQGKINYEQLQQIVMAQMSNHLLSMPF